MMIAELDFRCPAKKEKKAQAVAFSLLEKCMLMFVLTEIYETPEILIFVTSCPEFLACVQGTLRLM